MRPWLITVLGVFLAMSFACSDDDVADAPNQVILRFIEDDPEVELRSSPVFDFKPEFDWSWNRRTDPLRWVGSDVRLRIPKRGGLQGTVQGLHPTLEADVAIEAENIDVLDHPGSYSLQTAATGIDDP